MQTLERALMGHLGNLSRRASQAFVAVAMLVCLKSRAAAQDAPVRIPIVVARFDNAGGERVLVSNGIPLPSGLLKASGVNAIRVLVGGAEQQVHVEALKGTHLDGSLRSVLVQFYSSLKAGTSLDGELLVGQPRRGPDLAKPAETPAIPSAAALPSDPAYLISTQLVGPTMTVKATRALGGVFAQYDRDFADAADKHWQRSGPQWGENYYDRAFIYYAMWVRSGEPEYWRRGTLMAHAYRKDYVEHSGYQPSAYWLMDEGIEVHYLMTGDPTSFFAVGRIAQQFVGCAHPNPNCYIGSLTSYMDVRNQARALQALFLAWRLGSPGDPKLGAHDWGAELANATNAVLATQSPDGGYKSQEFCNGIAPYQVGLLNDQLIKQWLYWKADPRLVTAVKKSVAWLWNTQLISPEQGFHYNSVPCPDNGMGTKVGGLEASPDLTAMLSTSFAFVAKQTGVADDIDRARTVFASGVRSAYNVGSKQFNQAYSSSYLALGFLPLTPVR